MSSTSNIQPTAARTNKPVLKKGERGVAVRELQKLLFDYGAFALDCDFGVPEVFIDGVFGDGTDGAVKAFQRQVFLKIDGIVGDITWQALINRVPMGLPILKKGSLDELVARVQQRLIVTGDYQGIVDGDFGLVTEDAVKTFQKRQKLTVDGEIGNSTWLALSKIQETVCEL